VSLEPELDGSWQQEAFIGLVGTERTVVLESDRLFKKTKILGELCGFFLCGG